MIAAGRTDTALTTAEVVDRPARLAYLDVGRDISARRAVRVVTTAVRRVSGIVQTERTDLASGSAQDRQRATEARDVVIDTAPDDQGAPATTVEIIALVQGAAG